jgi:uncharacterized membrane protein YfcA
MKYVATIALFLMAEVLGTVSGFGSSAFFVATAQFLLGFQTVLVFTAIQHVFGNFAKIWLFRKDLNWGIALKIGIPSLLATVLGAELSKVTDAHWPSLLLGAFLVIFPLLLLWRPDLRLAQHWFNALVGGGAAGFMAGLVGTGGAVRGLVLASFGLSKNAFVGTSSLIDAGVDISRSIVYLRAGYLQASEYWFVPILLGVAAGGSWLGKKALDRIPQEKFRTLVLLLLIATGLLLIIKQVGRY